MTWRFHEEYMHGIVTEYCTDMFIKIDAQHTNISDIGNDEYNVNYCRLFNSCPEYFKEL